MNEMIYKRKSVRKYDPAELDDVKAQIERAAPLYPDVRCSVEILPKAQVRARVSAPYYLIFGSEEKDGGLENIGFIGQRLSLYLSSKELGPCWLGMAKPENTSHEGI